ncbi:hypothetical protein [Shouchella lonarensis]|uniref:Modulator of DNA gyrase n=1 Tax=Shouchella lonarensis TaxID=1464122 RepID=A0A1G6N1U6_9BACI|nr:hypothetical protein [Shouchella lonarensis]SDC61808.1 Putative modulator of DNA gyrase [Shouchella lonarensis]
MIDWRLILMLLKKFWVGGPMEISVKTSFLERTLVIYPLTGKYQIGYVSAGYSTYDKDDQCEHLNSSYDLNYEGALLHEDLDPHSIEAYIPSWISCFRKILEECREEIVLTMKMCSLKKDLDSLGNPQTKDSIFIYTNVFFAYESREFQMTISSRSLQKIEEDLRKVIDRIIVFMNIHKALRPLSLENGKYDLLLKPHVAAVLFHECIAHGIEEGYLEKGDRVGPACLNIELSLKNDLINEGIPNYENHLIVNKGVVALGQDFVSSCKQTTFMFPRVRLTDLKVSTKNYCDGIPNPKSCLVCNYVNSAQFYKGIAIIEIKDALIVHDNITMGYTSSFYLRINVKSMYRHLVYINNDYELIEGICTKFNDSIPTCNQAPSVILEQVEIRGEK